MNQLKEIAKTCARVFAGSLLAAVVAAGVGVMEYGWTDWKPLVFAAFSAVAVVIINALNPADARYGLGSGAE